VAELVCEEIRRRVVVTHDDRPPEGVAAVPAKPGNAEESRLDEDADSRERNGDVVEVEPIEARLRIFETLSLVRKSVHRGHKKKPNAGAAWLCRAALTAISGDRPNPL
jgi:hypothetical protein